MVRLSGLVSYKQYLQGRQCSTLTFFWQSPMSSELQLASALSRASTANAPVAVGRQQGLINFTSRAALPRFLAIAISEIDSVLKLCGTSGTTIADGHYCSPCAANPHGEEYIETAELLPECD